MRHFQFFYYSKVFAAKNNKRIVFEYLFFLCFASRKKKKRQIWRRIHFFTIKKISGRPGRFRTESNVVNGSFSIPASTDVFSTAHRSASLKEWGKYTFSELCYYIIIYIWNIVTVSTILYTARVPRTHTQKRRNKKRTPSLPISAKNLVEATADLRESWNKMVRRWVVSGTRRIPWTIRFVFL